MCQRLHGTVAISCGKDIHDPPLGVVPVWDLDSGWALGWEGVGAGYAALLLFHRHQAEEEQDHQAEEEEQDHQAGKEQGQQGQEGSEEKCYLGGLNPG